MNNDRTAREKFWESLKRDKRVKYKEITEPEAVGSFSADEWDSLRFRITNQSLRLATCTNPPHRDPIVFRLFPPHLWDIRDGQIYRKVDGQWIRFVPDLKKNLERFE